ncbi:MAG: endo alpha-1,4 polygalactosaminidase [Anaerolineae bacterium]|nr:endo alpha-1,4 polygalactosaminidase [Anaerolineae bacterium]
MTKRLIFLIVFIGLLAQGQVSIAQESPTRDWAAINDYIIQLQRARANRLGGTAYDLVISDIALSANHREVIDELRNSAGGPKLVVAYMSIGQAATFQYYWKPEWKEGNWPDWVGEADPTWAGDVWVNYWDAEWQAIILTGPDAYIDRIIDLGFDGVLLDRVDAATYFREQGRTTAYQEMADFVLAIAEHARERSPDFGVFTINGEDIGLQFPDYLETVTGILVEDLYYGYPRDHAASPPEWTAEREAMLDQWVAAGKIVLTVDYTLIAEQIDDAYTRSAARGYIPYCAERGLSRMLIHEGHEPD